MALLVYAALLAWAISEGQWSSTVAAGVVLVIATVRSFRKPTMVSAGGVVRPWRRPSSVSWSDVDRVARPRPGIPVVQLWMKSGSTLTLDDLTADRTDEVSRIAGIPIGYSTHPGPSPAPAPVHRDTEADIDRRARALADRGQRLEREYRQLRGERLTEEPELSG